MMQKLKMKFNHLSDAILILQKITGTLLLN